MEKMKIDKELLEMLEKEFVTLEELEEIEEHEDVTQTENCGNSGRYIGWKWYNVVLKNEEEYSVYIK